ncbi:MhmaT1 transposase [Oopsacas minuta]|uniref:MhmaT1 transposase n=1 Tax=Oopsacas minuta TaxID=111878 RepID=A0AAV7JNT6_9METZ|nr:MhmaT1 transposase [Oopsacas minuta]
MTRHPTLSHRKIAARVKISNASTQRIVTKVLGYKSFKRTKTGSLTDTVIHKRVQRCRKLLTWLKSVNPKRIVFSDEKIFSIDEKCNSKNSCIYSISRKDIPEQFRTVQKSQYSKSVMVWAGISSIGKTPLVFVPEGTKINAKVYQDLILDKYVRNIGSTFMKGEKMIFQQDGAPAHIAKSTLQWLSSNVPAEGIRDLKNVFVCSKDFLDEEIQTSFSIHQPDGTYLEVPAKPKLQKDAMPRFLPGCPLHLSSSSETIPPRFDRSMREQHLIDTAINESLLQTKTKNFFRLPHWKTWYPKRSTRINDIRQLNDLLNEIENHSAPTNSPETFQHHVREATGSIRKAIYSLATGEESGNQQPLLSSLQFILCQLDNALIAKTMRQYNIETLILSLKCQLVSPVCYRYLQSLDCLSLPQLSTLKRLYFNFGLDSDFTKYLKQSVTQFNKWERNVVIQMDEIHVKSTFTYKGGKIIGSSLNPTDPAKTVLPS